ncbi:MAG: tyrosine-type recombinase/integrase [Magnetococcales bacterium]|nr:tyrosine-type recombinase/integrase [Magnetococcales bacterium]
MANTTIDPKKRTPSKRINFTKRALQALTPPAKGKRSYVYDTKTPGLAVSVTPAGTKSFFVHRKIEGRPERIVLGRFPDISVENARAMAARTVGQIAEGKNPAAMKRADREEMTFGELFQEFLDRHAMVHKKSWKDDVSLFNRYLKPMGKRKLSTIRKADVQRLHSKIGKSGHPYGANRMLSLISVLFNKAGDWGLWDKANPATGITKFKEKSRDRFLEADELPRFFQALAEEPNETIRDYFLISLLTGVRRANVLAMRWDEIHLERGTWRIPETKNGTPQTVPLVGAALTILASRQESATSEWVFPGRGKTGHLVEPKLGWARLRERSGLGDIRIHDLRRSLGSWQAATGANLSIIGKTLNHKNVATTAIYARLNIDPVRDSVEKATTAMLAAGGMLPEGDVIPLKQAGK